MSRLFLLIIASFLAFPAAAQESPRQPLLSLDDAVRMALERNYAIRAARNEAQIAANDYSLGNAGFLPSMSMSAQQSRRAFGGSSRGADGQPVFGTFHTFDLAMNVSTTLFDGFGQFAAYERLASQKEQVALGAERTAEEALANVVLAYYDLARRQQQIEAIDEAVEISEERLEIARLRHEVGSASELEVRRAQVDLNADRAALLRQQVGLGNAMTTFNQLIARDGGLDFSVTDTIHVDRSLQPDRLAASARSRNRTLLAARQAQETALLTRKELRADWLPSLNLQLGYAFNDFTQQLGLPISRPGGLNYGLSATWDLFDGFNRERRLENASLRLRNAELAIEEARTQLVTRLDNVFHTYRNSLALVDLERENVSLARSNVDVALEQFRLGTITSVELREVQSALTSAESRFIDAQFEAKRAETELHQLSGTLLDRLQPGR